MCTIILIVIALVCACGWLNEKVVSTAILRWALDRCDQPPGEEIKEYLAWSWKNTLGLK